MNKTREISQSEAEAEVMKINESLAKIGFDGGFILIGEKGGKLSSTSKQFLNEDPVLTTVSAVFMLSSMFGQDFVREFIPKLIESMPDDISEYVKSGRQEIH